MGDIVEEPFPIFCVEDRYMLYDVNVVSHIRAKHHMCGCLSGTLPQFPQQNVFLGLPLQLMTEEAALLVEKGAAYITDDVAAHQTGLKSMVEADKQAYLRKREAESLAESRSHQKLKLKQREVHIGTGTPKSHKNKTEDQPSEPAAEEEESLFTPAALPNFKVPSKISNTTTNPAATKHAQQEEETLFTTPAAASSNSTDPHPPLQFYLNSTTSSPPYHLPSPSTALSVQPKPNPAAYALYTHLQSKGYFLSPGLRFGCQFMAYPGDPLRFHSHFVAQGLGWDEEIPIIDIVGGGRLGTGVKKAWVFGGKTEESGEGKEEEQGDGVRVFCVEWGGF